MEILIANCEELFLHIPDDFHLTIPKITLSCILDIIRITQIENLDHLVAFNVQELLFERKPWFNLSVFLHRKKIEEVGRQVLPGDVVFYQTF